MNTPGNGVRKFEHFVHFVEQRLSAFSNDVGLVFFFYDDAMQEGKDVGMAEDLEALKHGLGEGMCARFEAEDGNQFRSVLYILSVPQRPAKVAIETRTGLYLPNWLVGELVLSAAHLLAHEWNDQKAPRTPLRAPWLLERSYQKWNKTNRLVRKPNILLICTRSRHWASDNCRKFSVTS